jgi:hypothetical protein
MRGDTAGHGAQADANDPSTPTAQSKDNAADKRRGQTPAHGQK